MRKIAALIFISCFSYFSYAQGTWSSLGSGIRSIDCSKCGPLIAYAICPDTVHNILYVGGNFDTAGSINQQGIAKWDGTKWDSIPNRGFVYVEALIMYHDTLYVGDTYSKGVWRFDGSNWSQLGSLNSGITCFAIYRDTLYAAGDFTLNNTTKLNHIGKWDGIEWLPLKDGLDGSYYNVSAMTVFHDTLFIGGEFGIDSVSAYSIAKWDGSNWSAVGKGILTCSGCSLIPGDVYALETFQGKLFVGGQFNSIGGAGTYSVAIWNGNQWDTLSEPNLFNTSYVYGLKSFNGYLFMSSTGAIGFISKYDGNTLSTVDSGVNAGVYSIASWNGSLYVGGEFDSVDGSIYLKTAGNPLSANAIAQWMPDTISTTIQHLSEDNNQLSIYPNPTTSEITVKINSYATDLSGWNLKLIDILGRTIYSMPSLNYTNIINLETLSAAMYFITVTTNTGRTVVPVVKVN